MLVGVAHDESDGASGRFSLKHPTEQLHLVSLFPAGGDGALPGSSSVQFVLYEVEVDVDASRHSVDHPTHGGSVAFSKGGEGEKVAK